MLQRIIRQKMRVAMVDQGAAKLIPDHEAKDSLIVESLLLSSRHSDIKSGSHSMRFDWLDLMQQRISHK
jgi:hypothetical protein